MYVDTRNVYCELGALTLVIDFISILIKYTQSSRPKADRGLLYWMNEAIYLPNERNDTLIEILTFFLSENTVAIFY